MISSVLNGTEDKLISSVHIIYISSLLLNSFNDIFCIIGITKNDKGNEIPIPIILLVIKILRKSDSNGEIPPPNHVIKKLMTILKIIAIAVLKNIICFLFILNPLNIIS